jgi:hypothetical protein
MPGKQLDLSPLAEYGTEQICGPEMGPRVLKDTTNMFTIDPELEDEMMANGIVVDVHEADNDQQHLPVHMKAASMNGDPMGVYKEHMARHMQNMQRKREMAMAAQAPKGLPGAPGGGQPGAAGSPRPGAMPAPGGPRPAQGPAGTVQTDAMMGAPGRG